MKKVVTIFFLLFSFAMVYAAEPDSTIVDQNNSGPIDRENCTCKDIPLYGRVQVVTSFADFDVRVVTSFPDLDVEVVTSFPDRCGKWEFVNSFPDFTIRFVESFPDFTIQFVNSFPGVH